MNRVFKSQVIAEIRKPSNKIKILKRPSGEEISVVSSTGRTIIEVFKADDKKLLKIGGEEIIVDDKDFDDIELELNICYASDMKQSAFDDGKPKIPMNIFSELAKEK